MATRGRRADQASDRDRPNYSLAWADLDGLRWRRNQRRCAAANRCPLARDAAQQAADLSAGHPSRGYDPWPSSGLTAAEAALRLAVRLDQSNANA
jgi:hypothetical protein